MCVCVCCVCVCVCGMHMGWGILMCAHYMHMDIALAYTFTTGKIDQLKFCFESRWCREVVWG